jgi:glycosyltransferase involved in cell wall biosynthesis
MELDNEVIVVIPAYNEELCVAAVVSEVLAAAPKVHVLVIDDASTDSTARAARAAGAEVITNVFNLGVGGAMRVGFRYAEAHNFRALVQVDGDGQHNARDVANLVASLDDVPEPAIVIGARFAGNGEYSVRRARRWAMRLLAWYLSRVTHAHLTDVTSGFRAHNRAAIELFARTYPSDYLADTVESIVIATEAGGTFTQVPVEMRSRSGGAPSQSSWRAATYLARVLLMLAVSILRHRSARPTTTEELS